MQPRRLGLFVAACLAAAAAMADPVNGLDQAALLLGQGRLQEALAQLRRDPPVPADAQRRDLMAGLLLHRLGRDAEAVAPLERALARDPGEFDGRIDLGQALQASGRWDLAQAQFQEAARRSPLRAEPWLGLGQIAAGEDRVVEARACFEKAVGLDPLCAAAWLGLSDALLKQGLLSQAALDRDKAIGLGGGDAEIEFKQAVAWYGLGDLGRSEQALKAAGQGDRPEAFFLAGCLQYRQGQWAAAESDFSAAIASKPGYRQAQLNLGMTYYSAGRYDEALAQFDQLIRRGDDPEAVAYRRDAAAASSDHYFRLGSQALLAGDLLGALEPLQKAAGLALDKDKLAIEGLIQRIRQQQGPEALTLDRQARQALKMKDLPRAVLFWQDALRLDPSMAAAKQGLDSVKGDIRLVGQAYARAARLADAAGDASGAQALAQRLAKLDAAAGLALQQSLKQALRGREDALLADGTLQLGQGRPRQAPERFDRILAADPGDGRAVELRQQALAAQRAQVRGFLALALEADAQGDEQRAYRQMQLAVAADPEDLEARQGVRRLSARLNLKRDGVLQAEDLYYQGVYAYGDGDTVKALALWREGLRLDPDQGLLLQAVRSADLKVKALALLGRP